MRLKTRWRVSSLMSPWLRNTLEIVTTETPRSRAMSFIRTRIVLRGKSSGPCNPENDRVPCEICWGHLHGEFCLVLPPLNSTVCAEQFHILNFAHLLRAAKRQRRNARLLLGLAHHEGVKCFAFRCEAYIFCCERLPKAFIERACLMMLGSYRLCAGNDC